MLLVLRLTLVPIFIALVTLAARRWGPRAAAFVTAFPVVAGPTLGFYVVQQGNMFAARAAEASLIGLVGVAAFCAAYGHLAARWRWPVCVATGWLSFGAITMLTLRTAVGAVVGLAVAVAALMLVRELLPMPGPVGSVQMPPKWDLPLRMCSAAALVFALTAAADRLGPALSGLLTPFPVATAIIAGFTHAQQGSGAVVRFLRGYMPSLCSFAIFCFVLALTLPRVSAPLSFAAALALQLAAQGIMLAIANRAG
jgi:hypothetical protein